MEVELSVQDRMLRLNVRDCGIGIPEADLKRSFTSFHRGENVGAIPGTGLGLVIAHDSVELHGGEFWLTARWGVGTVFTIYLPATLTPTIPVEMDWSE